MFVLLLEKMGIPLKSKEIHEPRESEFITNMQLEPILYEGLTTDNKL